MSTMTQPPPPTLRSAAWLDRTDGWLALGLLLLAGLYTISFARSSLHPYEDAAMLMRYSEHLAQGHGIVWNVGEKPVDGATDFLVMVLVAGLVKAGLGVESATRLLGFLSHLVTVLVIYWSLRRLQGAGRGLSLISAVYLALGPAALYIAAGFETPFFALFVCVTWCFAIKIQQGDDSLRWPVLFAWSALLMGLARPEGVFLAVLMVLALLYARGLQGSRRVFLHFAVAYGSIGAMYFLWRWHYFGYPLPNPFYRKGAGHFYGMSLYHSIRNAGLLTFPFPLAFLLGFRSKRTVRKTIFSLIPIGGFVALWVLLLDAQNFQKRFQYPLLVLVLLSWTEPLRGLRDDLQLPRFEDLDGRGRKALLGFGLALLLIVLAFEHRQFGSVGYDGDGRYDVAVMLSHYREKNYSLATTDPGILPFYSGWRSIDTWGLNDPWITHHGSITESYLDRYAPQVIMFDDRFTHWVPDREWVPGMVELLTLREYVRKNNYCLAAAFGDSPYRVHLYYVRTDFPDAADIISRIRGQNYIWVYTGMRSINFAAGLYSCGPKDP